MGPELALKLEALLIGVFMLSVGVAASLFLFDRYGPRRPTNKATEIEPRDSDMSRDELEDRVRVLERIATDARADMAREFDELRQEKETN